MSRRWFLLSESARTEARILAFVDVVTSIFYLTLWTVLAYVLVHNPQWLQKFIEEDVEHHQDLAKLLAYSPAKQAFFLATWILRPLTSFMLAIFLLIGAHKRKYFMVRICQVVSILYIIVDLILLIPRTIYLQNGTVFVLVYLCNFIYMLYELRVVFALLSDLKAISEEGKGDEEAEPGTDDTVVVEAEADPDAADN